MIASAEMISEKNDIVSYSGKSPSQRLMQMLTGFWISQSLFTVSKLKISDSLKEGPRPISYLANTLNINEDNLYRILRALSRVGIYNEIEKRIFELTPLSELLLSSHPDSMLQISIMLSRENYNAWNFLDQAIKSGASPFECAYKMPVYEYFKNNLDAYTIFNEAMTAIVKNDNKVILNAYNFISGSKVFDIGSGQGLLLIEVLNKYSDISGALFDLPEVLKDSSILLEQNNIKNRCEIITGDFFNSVPQNGDYYILSRILHTFDDEKCLKILQNISDAINPTGKLLIMEAVITEDSVDAALMDINMMIFAAGGRDRTQAEYSELLSKAHFRIDNIITTENTISILECSKC